MAKKTISQPSEGSSEGARSYLYLYLARPLCRTAHLRRDRGHVSR